MNYNKLIIGARLVRDPEMRILPNGTAICQFSVAVSRKFKTDNQEREETSFIDCEAWAKTGELIAKHFSKGKAIFCEGRLKQDTWEDKDAKAKRSKLKMVVENFQFVGSKDAAPSSEQAQAPSSAPSFKEESPADDLAF